MGVSAIVGVTGSLLFPVLRKKVNVTRTGIIGFSSLILTLCLCLAAIFLPGSPFELLHDKVPSDNNSTMNVTQLVDTVVGSEDCQVDSFCSVSTLLTGIILARFGLWISDLSVTQALQEGVEEQIRGTVGGVQGALNENMNMIKFVLVIVLPDADTFGYLVMASVAFICLGFVFYAFYASRNWHGTVGAVPVKEEAREGTKRGSGKSYGSTDVREVTS